MTSNWETSTLYDIKDIVLYDDIPYECIMSHKSLSCWTPSNTLDMLWKRVTEEKESKSNLTKAEAEIAFLKEENARLKAKNSELTNHIECMPDGQAYFEAKKHFESNINK